MDSNISPRLKARFGGERKLFRYGITVDIGGEILGEDKFFSLPTAINTYERCMGLLPLEAWLLMRILKHDWDDDCKVTHFSQNQTVREAIIGSKKVQKILRSLEAKGFIKRCEGLRGNPMDRKIPYSVDQAYLALWICIHCDPFSNCAEEYQGIWNLEAAESFAMEQGIVLNWKAIKERVKDFNEVHPEKEYSVYDFNYAMSFDREDDCDD